VRRSGGEARYNAPMRSLLAVAICLACPASTLASPESGSIEPPPPLSGQVSVAGIGKMTWELHYNRNALLDSRRVPGGWVALSEVGSLMLFDEELRHLRKEHFGRVPATCLAVDSEGAVFAGFADGKLAAVKGPSLALKPVATVASAVLWMGHRPKGWVVVHVLGTVSTHPNAIAVGLFGKGLLFLDVR
jgi:hypothetical protein